MEYKDKEVRFDLYCGSCKHYETNKTNDICDECLESPSNEHSHKPVKYEESNNKTDKTRRKTNNG